MNDNSGNAETYDLIDNPEEAATAIADIIAADGLAMIVLGRYRIGVDYEVECTASALTVSREHTSRLKRHGSVMRCRTFFPPALLPQKYCGRVGPGDVIEIGLEFSLVDVTAISIICSDDSWRKHR